MDDPSVAESSQDAYMGTDMDTSHAEHPRRTHLAHVVASFNNDDDDYYGLAPSL
jgi:hypothetical protein